MESPTEKELVAQARALLAELVDLPCHEVEPNAPGAAPSAPDAVLRAGQTMYVLECRVAVSTAALYQAIRMLKAQAAQARTGDIAADVVPLLVVPFMGPTGRTLCDEEACSWLDLSGNASIRAPGLLIRVEGKPNRFRRRGRPASVFSPMASRITRVLLTYPDMHLSQRHLAMRTGVDEGYVSRIVRNLADQGLVARDNDNLVRATDPDLLLRAWLDAYDFGKHRRIMGHVPARDGDELVRMLAEALARQPHQPTYAATGLAAAWCMGRHAAFRTASIYVHDETALEDLGELSFRRTDRGANVWMLVPEDAGVFQGVATCDGVHCVAPVQVYLDLHAHAERAPDVALEFQRRHLDWTKTK